jgi:FkbM family methyltransferase
MYSGFHGEVFNNIHLDASLREYFPDYSYKGVFLDVGAFEPIKISNSYHFENNGWDVYCFEANTNGIPLLKEYRKNVFNYAIYDEDKDAFQFNVVESNGWTAGFSAIELSDEISKTFVCNNKIITQVTVPQRKLNTIMVNELKHITTIDILSIDIEGGEQKCLYGFDLSKYIPKIILIENINTNINLQRYIEKYGYILDKTISYNQIYRHTSFVPNTHKSSNNV